jgi:hypothetical protein
MLHSRADYNRIQDPEGKIPENEPVLLFRGQDKFSAGIVRTYANLVEGDGGDPEMVAALRKHADLMDAWPKKKQPDVKASA